VAGAAVLSVGVLTQLKRYSTDVSVVALTDSTAFIAPGRGPVRASDAAVSVSQPAPGVAVGAEKATGVSTSTAASAAAVLGLAAIASKTGKASRAQRHRAVVTSRNVHVEAPVQSEKSDNSAAMAGVALVVAAAVVVTGADPAAAAEAAVVDAVQLAATAATAASTAVAGATASTDAAAVGQAVVEAAKVPNELDEGTDFFSPFVQANAGIIAGIDDVLEEVLKVPNSFGFAIIAYTVLIKAITFPLNQSALRANAMMQLVGPKIKQIQTKYKNDQETLNRMTLRLYDDCGINPLGGCLPSVVQLPIFIGLYRAISSLAAKNPRFSEPFLWIPSLSGPVEVGKPSLDWLTKSKLADGFEPLVGWQDAGCYCILPVMLVASQFVTQKMSAPQQTDGGPVALISNFFPLIIGYTTLVSPAGLGIYWFCNNTLTALQTQFIRNGLKAEFPEYEKLLDGQSKVPETTKKEAKEKKEAPSFAARRGFSAAPETVEAESVAPEASEAEAEPVEVAAAGPSKKRSVAGAARDARDSRKTKRIAKKKRSR